MIATKNGVVAELAEYGCTINTDAYMLGDVLILRTSANRAYGALSMPESNIIVNRIEHWFDERKDYGTMIVLPGDWEGSLA